MPTRPTGGPLGLLGAVGSRVRRGPAVRPDLGDPVEGWGHVPASR